MRWISLPEELAPPHLLDVRDTSPPLRDLFTQLGNHLTTGGLEPALTLSGRAFGIAKSRFDRYGQALALLYRAEACRRLERWEDGLDAIRSALHWLELQVAPVARYNEAIAVYLEGAIHFTLQSRERTSATFSYAQHVLAETERHWGFEQNTGRVADCRNLTQWISGLLDIEGTLPPHGMVAILPVYELVNRTPIRTDMVAIEAIEVMMPGEVLAQYLPSDVQPLQLGGLLFPCLRLPGQYVAIRISDSAAASGKGRQGDLLIVEVAGSVSSAGEIVLTSDRPFVRRADGRVEFLPFSQDAMGPVQLSERGMAGIARVLKREGSDE